MSEYKNNHYSPRAILRKWETLEKNRWGVHIYDLIKDKYYFSCSRCKGAFSFAKSDYLYVPEVDGQRIPNVEKWFNGIETILSAAISRIEKEDNTPLFSRVDDTFKFIIALMSFKHRNEYNLKSIKKKLEGNEELKFNISGIAGRDIDLLVLENMINACEEDSRDYWQSELMILSTSENKSLIYCDRPFIEDAVDGYSFLPLTDKRFIAVKKTNEPSFYLHQKSNDGLVDSINSIIAEQSRNWIMADSRELLDQYIETAKKSNCEIEALYKPTKHLRRGNIIK